MSQFLAEAVSEAMLAEAQKRGFAGEVHVMTYPSLPAPHLTLPYLSGEVHVTSLPCLALLLLSST